MSFSQRDVVAVVEIRIGEVDREHGVVVAHVRAEQQRLLAVQRQLETGEETRVGMEQPVRIAGRGADVAVAVGDDEGIAAFERTPRARDGLRRGNIERRFRQAHRRASALPAMDFQPPSTPSRLGPQFGTQFHAETRRAWKEFHMGRRPARIRERDSNCRMRHQYGRTDGAVCEKLAKNDAGRRRERQAATPLSFPDMSNNSRAWRPGEHDSGPPVLRFQNEPARHRETDARHA